MSDTGNGNPVRLLCTYSGGLVSYAAAKRAIERHGREGTVLLFADTIIEDNDLYRFLIETAAHLTGVEDRDAVAELAGRASRLPEPASGRMAERKQLLRELRADAADAIPSLAWIADGRTPWEVFVDERFVGNSRIDPCSKKLKRELMDRWRADHCDPATTVCVYGLDWTERHRIEGRCGRKGHRARQAEAGWAASYPMDERPYLIRGDIVAGLAAVGIAPPRLYDMGFTHNNCAGLCVKGGMGQARHLLRVNPAYYRWSEGQERWAMAEIGPTARPFLRDRSGGETMGVTMAEFRRRCESLPLLDGLEDDDIGGCGCAIDDEEEGI